MKERLRLWSDKLFKPVENLPTGIYHYQSAQEEKQQYRLHLRVEPDGNGVLILNASTVLHLNQTATEYAYHLIQKRPLDEISAIVAKRYRVSSTQARMDLDVFKAQLDTLIHTPDLSPDIYMDVERYEPYSKPISAPYRLDCALTYQTSESGDKNLTPVDRVKRELLLDEWKTILKKAWSAGIPHVIFTGGEPTLRPDLPELIAFTEDLGMVCGLLTDGFRLAEKKYLHQLLNAGLDHLMIVLDPEEDQAWEAIRDAMAEDIYTTVHLTITKNNKDRYKTFIQQFSKMKISSLSLSINDPELDKELESARSYAGELELGLVWDLPVPYSSFHPVALELAQHQEQTKGAGKAWLYVEPDGDVLPEQGENKVLGNLLTDEWSTIWKN